MSTLSRWVGDKYLDAYAETYQRYRDEGFIHRDAKHYAKRQVRREEVPSGKDKTLGMYAGRWALCVLAVAAGVFTAVFGVVWVIQAWETMYWEKALAITIGVISVVAGSIFFSMIKDDM